MSFEPSCILLMGMLTRSIGNWVKIVSWYDNEVGISDRLAELTVELAGRLNSFVEA